MFRYDFATLRESPTMEGPGRGRSMTSALLHVFCPAPRRFLQWHVTRLGLRTGLDVGCGETSVLAALRSRSFVSVGLDIGLPSVVEARRRNQHDAYLVADLRRLPLREQFDVVVLSHIIEHFSHEEGLDVLRVAEALSRVLTYVETPFGFREQPALGGDPFQRHRSGWFPHDFEGRGYAVYGGGLRGLRGVAGVARLFPESITRFIERATQRIVFNHPVLAGTISAIRFVDGAANLRRL